MTVDVAWIKERARSPHRVPHFEDFEVGQHIRHKCGRTLTESDNLIFSALTLNYNPRFFNRDFAQQHGHADLVVNPMLVTLTTIGLSVQDLSEAGGAFLGIEDLVQHRQLVVGETLTAASEVLAARRSSSRPETGIVTWATAGSVGDEAVVSFVRTNMIPCRTGRSGA